MFYYAYIGGYFERLARKKSPAIHLWTTAHNMRTLFPFLLQ